MKKLLILLVILVFCFGFSLVKGQEKTLSKEEAEKVILRCFNEIEGCKGEDFFAFKVWEIDDSSIVLAEMIAEGKSEGKAYLKLIKDNNTWKIGEFSMDNKEWMKFEDMIEDINEGCEDMKEKRKKNETRKQNPVEVTMDDLEGIGFTIDAYKEDTGKVPETDSLEKVAEVIKEYYSFRTLMDIWGNPFLYQAEGDTYWVASAGSDGKFDGFNQTGQYDPDETKDIIFSNGAFTYRPKE
jgi:hypothetical protein